MGINKLHLHRRVIPSPRKIYRTPVHVARAWHSHIAEGLFESAADLSRHVGVSRARVTQVLNLLRLAPDVLDSITDLGDPLSSPLVTERMLRNLIDLPVKGQKARIEVMLFAARSGPM